MSLNGFFLVVNEHGRKHNLAKTFDASRKAIVTSWLILPGNANIVDWYSGGCYQRAHQ